LFGNNIFVAYKNFQSLLSKVYGRTYNRNELNKGRHCLLKPVEGNTPSFYCVFKREVFHSFYKQFETFCGLNPDASKVGASINEFCLRRVIQMDVDYLVFVYPTRAYFVYPRQFYNFAKIHRLIRSQDRNNVYKTGDYTGRQQKVSEITVSNPLSALNNIFDLKEFQAHKPTHSKNDVGNGNQSLLTGF